MSALSADFADEQRRSVSVWAPQLPSQAGATPVRQALLQAVQHSASGWDHITQARQLLLLSRAILPSCPAVALA